MSQEAEEKKDEPAEAKEGGEKRERDDKAAGSEPAAKKPTPTKDAADATEGEEKAEAK